MEIIKRKPGQPKRQVVLDLTVPIEPVEYKIKPAKYRVAIFDTETDPFYPGVIVAPFTCGYYLPDTGEYFDFWGDDCIHQFFAHLADMHGEETLAFYVHNGGNFDFYFMTDYLDKGHAPFIINGRLVKIKMQGHDFRDSYAMIPVALGTYDKIKIDYDKMQNWPCSIVATRQLTTVREFYREEIQVYMRRDCTSLAELVTSYLDMFGDKLTMASVALPMLRSYHGFDTMWNAIDDTLRPYYFGGRNECFAVGEMTGAFKIYDINSSYPDVMRRYQHPISANPIVTNKITDETFFAHVTAWSLGALPVRNEKGGLEFPRGTREFFACIHEIKAGIETGTLRIIKVHKAYGFEQTTSFDTFIDTFYKLRMEASDNNDEIRKLFYKLVMNSSYGKFAQDPRKYENYLFDPDEMPTPTYCDDCYSQIEIDPSKPYCSKCVEGVTSPYGWYLHSINQGRFMYAQKQEHKRRSFFNVATAASITSAARASLLYAIKAAKRPLYCDTDSLICEGFEPSPYMRFGDKELGAWKTEAEGDTVCIAGKKMYAVFDKGQPIKSASKGVRLTPDEIARVCAGEVIEYASPVPKFSLGNEPQFVTRKIKRTGAVI